jgi:hypothetical protein
VTTDGARGSLWSDLVNGLLDARTDPATAKFDAELASAVAAGELSRRTAQRLRFWQRAAVNAADDHARTVVPAVLGVLDAARSEAHAYVEQGGATLDAADTADAADATAQEVERATADDPTSWATGPTTPPPAEPPPGEARPERPRGTPGQPPTAAQQAEPAPTAHTRIEDLRRASTAGSERPSTLEGPAPRLFVADLRDVPATDRP